MKKEKEVSSAWGCLLFAFILVVSCIPPAGFMLGVAILVKYFLK